MKFDKVPYINLIPIILISIILFRIVNNVENIGYVISKILALLSYFVWGFGIAYLLNPVMQYLESKVKIKRSWALLIVYTFFIGIIVLVCVLIIPVLVKNIADLLNNMPVYINKVEQWILKITTNNKYILKTNVSNYLGNTLDGLFKNANNYVGTGLSILFGNLINLSNLVIKITTGIVISVYFLKDKENILLNIKKLLMIVTDDRKTRIIIDFGNKVNNIFKRFVIGKFIDSILVGCICFIALVILKVPYAIFLSIIVGITNMIPYFGGFIGLGISCLITLFYSPIKSIEVAVMLLVLGEIDGLYMGPKILGEKIGLNPLWIILGITIGGGLYGFIGMFLGVPMFAVIKMLLQEFMERRLKEL